MFTVRLHCEVGTNGLTFELFLNQLFKRIIRKCEYLSIKLPNEHEVMEFGHITIVLFNKNILVAIKKNFKDPKCISYTFHILFLLLQ